MRDTAYLPHDARRERYPAAVADEARGRSGFLRRDLLWIPAVFIFGLGDILSTQMALSLGGMENNVLVKYLLEGPGGIWTFSLVKAAVLVPLVLLTLSLGGKYRWLVPGCLCAAGLYLLGGNVSVILNLI